MEMGTPTSHGSDVLNYSAGNDASLRTLPPAPLYPLGPGDLRNAILCGLAVVVAVALTLPVANSPFNDDWSYSFTVKKLYETGKLTYNGWASASLIAQAYWGLLWLKVYGGFSYTVLRFSTLPFAAAAISICYLLARRTGLSTHFSAFASLLVGLSPVYLPEACTFMTDAPGLFFILLSIYAMTRAIESPRTNIAVSWIVAGFLIGFIGGTGRQIVWLAPLIVAPYTAWIRRKNLAIVICCIAGWLLLLGGVLFTLHWFAVQDYAIPEMPLKESLHAALKKKSHYVMSVLGIGLTLIWVILPALWGLTRNWTGNRALIALLVLIGPVMVLAKTRPRYTVAPWMGNCLSAQGVMAGAELPGLRPTAMPLVVRVLFAIVVFAVASVVLADLLIWLSRPFKAWKKTIDFFLFPPPGQALLPVMILFGLAYVTMLLPRCATNMVYDRYMIPLMPCVLFPILYFCQWHGDRRVPKAGWILFGMYALYSICITQDVTALSRARTTASERLAASGISAQQVVGGFEHDYQAQLDATGYINDRRIHKPKGAYNPKLGDTYTIRPLYRLEHAPAIDTAVTGFGAVAYFSYLYPFHRFVYIDKFIDPYWLNPAEAATRPSSQYHAIAPAGLSDDNDK